MDVTTASLWFLVGIGVLLIVTLLAWPAGITNRGGKMLAFIAFFMIPVLATVLGTEEHMERSKQTQFCLSCHVMEPYGRSLLADDPSFIPGAHFQNHRIPADQACFTCHTDYVLYGEALTKLRGLRHVYVQYFGTPPAPESIHLYTPFNNRECLHCHLGARSFEEGSVHTADPDTMTAIKENKLSCVSSGCHEAIHDVAHLNKVKLWEPPRQNPLPIQ